MLDINTLLYRYYDEVAYNFRKYKSSDKVFRIIFQKYGLFFDYIFNVGIKHYSLYLNGPYNSALAKVGYEIADDILYYEAESSSIDISEKNIELLQQLSDAFEMDDRLLELFSTYIYLLKENNLPQESALKMLRSIKGHLLDSTGSYSLNHIQELHLKFLQNNIYQAAFNG